jgi:hypothetical protein
MSLIESEATLRGSLRKTTKSASLPGMIEPLVFSSNVA